MLKETLVAMDLDNNGRVNLVDFYAKWNVSNSWFLEETPDYLRAQGVLDETDPDMGSQVIIPNYVQSLSNCIEVSEFYSICCIKECDSVVGTIEREVKAAMATPTEILWSAQRIIDRTEEEPRNLTAQLVQQLWVVAELRNGMVPLHGRLFAQWLHYAFPYECPYPQKKSEAEMSAVISEYSDRTGLPSMMTEEEREEYVLEHSGEQERPLAKAVVDVETEMAAEFQAFVISEEPRERSPLDALNLTQWTMDDDEYYVHHHHQIRAVDIRGWFGRLRVGVWLGRLATLGIITGGVMALKHIVAEHTAAFDPKSWKLKAWVGKGSTHLV